MPDGAPSGPAVDMYGQPSPDPTENVFKLVAANERRQDDLRTLESVNMREKVDDAAKHQSEVMALRAQYEDKLRTAEANRIDAIRSVDVAAVQRAAEVAAEAVQTLAAQVPITAEAVRTSLAAALDPILKDVQELRRVQYEQQGQRLAVTEGKSDTTFVRQGVAIAISVGSLLLSAGLGIALALK